MYRILIVDDEPLIVEGLVHLLLEAQLDVDIFKAYSAIEALHILKENKIDILMTDIRMPQMSGLQLLEEVLTYWPTCKTIFLTGYSEFNYVYSAIQNQGIKYILKTEGDEVILNMINELIREIDKDTRQKLFIEQAKNQLHFMTPILKKELFMEILSGKLIPGDIRKERFKELNICLNPFQDVLMIMCKYYLGYETVPYSKKMKMIYHIKQLFDSNIGTNMLNEYVIDKDGHIVFLLQSQEKDILTNADDTVMINYIKANLEEIQNICKKELSAAISFAISRNTVKWEHVHKELAYLKKLFKNIGQHQMLIIDDDFIENFFNFNHESVIFDSIEFKRKLQSIENNMDEGNLDKFDQNYQTLISYIDKNDKNNYFTRLEMYYSLILTFISYINQNKDISSLVMKNVNINTLLDIDIHKDNQMLELNLHTLGKLICKYRKKKIENTDHSVLNHIHSYIKSNLDKDLTLTKIANQVYLNPSYLSRFYKQYTGKKLSDYINELKIIEAKKLLKTHHLKINEVGFKLGFKSPSYFTSFFKKMTTLTPNEYRFSFNKAEDI